MTETEFISKDNFKIVSGIGINVNSDENDFKILNKKATSLLLELKNQIDLDDFTKSFIKKLTWNFKSFFENKITKDIIKEQWLKYCNIIGKVVEVKNIANDYEKDINFSNNFSNDLNYLNNINFINKNKAVDNINFYGKVIDIDEEGFLVLKTRDNIQKIISGDISILEGDGDY